MIIKNMLQVPAQPVAMEGAKDVTVRVLVGPQDDAPTLDRKSVVVGKSV